MHAEAASDPLRKRRYSSEDPFPVRLRLLGDFSVWVGSRAVGEGAWHLRKAKSLVKLLALAPGHRLHREQVMDLLWPGLGRMAASNNLRQALHTARQALEPDLPADSCYLASQDESLVLCPGGSLWVDVEAFEQAASTARSSREPAAYEAALILYAGELLPTDRYEEWAEEHRLRLHETYLSLLLGLARLHEERGEYGLAIEALRRVVAEEPAREEAHVRLMRLYALAGSKGEALAQYVQLEEILAREWGTEPAASSRALRKEIAAGRFPPNDGVPFGSAPEEPAGTARRNLPAPRTSFVGREREMIEVKRMMAMTRLLTITGAGGSGKTRLALEVARDLVGAYPDGVWLAELAPLADPGLVPQAVARALGVKEQPGQPLTDTLAEALAGKEVLLVIDNCEHLVEEAARLVDTLLASCPLLRVLATTREPLAVPGEVNWAVPPLSLPETTSGVTTADALVRYGSVRLFVDRARLRLPDFELTQENALAVSRVCRKLDGIPLALELATAKMGALAVEQVAQRLEASLDVLKGTSRSAAPRQQTLRATLDWSHDLLSDDERTFFRRLSVFAGRWTLEAAEAVCSGNGIEEDGVLDLHSGLVDKSLVVAEATGGGGVRYRMLEPIRQYAQEKFEEGGEAEEVKRRHASFFLALAEDAEPRLRGPEDVEWLERLEVEHYNMRAALSWALEQGVDEVALRLAGALGWFWEAHGHFSEGRRWLEEALAQDDQASIAARVKALDPLSVLVSGQQDLDRGEALAQEGLKLSEQAGLGGAEAAMFLRTFGWIAMVRGDYARMNEVFEESLGLSRDADDKWGIAYSLLGLGTALSSLDDRERGKELYQEGIGLARELCYAPVLARFLFSLGYILLLEGAYERGAALNEEAVAVFREHGYKGGFELALNSLGWAALLQGDHDRARTSYQECLTLCKELRNKRTASESLEGIACIAAAEGEAERAARLFGAALGLPGAVGYPHFPEYDAWREPYLATARSRLDEAVWEAAFAEGQAMTFEEAVEYALSDKKRPSPLVPMPEEPSAAQPPVVLTRREREVAGLVGRGLISRQIASQLHISEHTVDKHVANILRKLNLHSREQVGAKMAEQCSHPF
jgi:predicted ATPase/DNA-binding SARP family transcriptional activator/DNA-binding CsgD family transcriptional regulator